MARGIPLKGAWSKQHVGSNLRAAGRSAGDSGQWISPQETDTGEHCELTAEGLFHEGSFGQLQYLCCSSLAPSLASQPYFSLFPLGGAREIKKSTAGSRSHTPSTWISMLESISGAPTKHKHSDAMLLHHACAPSLLAQQPAV